MGNVVDLKLVEVGESYRFKAQKLLEKAIEYDFERMAIIGRLEDGELYVSGTANAGETLVLLEQAKHMVVFGKDGIKK